MRLDKYLSECNIGTRSEVKEYIKKGSIKVGDNIIKKADFQVSEGVDSIYFKNELITYKKNIYIMLNKPSGVITASRDKKAETVLDLIKPLPAKDLFAVGRLDKDTTGILIICNDGVLSHNLLSPKKHVDKTYIVNTKYPISENDLICLQNGVDIGDEKPTLPAKAYINSDNELVLTIHEGRYHQVKRMLEAINNEVIKLHRYSFGSVILDESLKPGEWRELNENELKALIFQRDI